MSNKKLTLTVSSLVLVVLAVGVFFFAIKSQEAIPGNIKNQVTSAIFLAQSPQATVSRSSFKYDSKLKQLSYLAKFKGKTVIVSEQPSPDAFGDSQPYFNQWIASTGAYTDFPSESGTVYLAHNPNYGANSIAIMNEKGTLLFAKPSNTALTDDEWKQFFLTIKPQ